MLLNINLWKVCYSKIQYLPLYNYNPEISLQLFFTDARDFPEF